MVTTRKRKYKVQDQSDSFSDDGSNSPNNKGILHSIDDESDDTDNDSDGFMDDLESVIGDPDDDYRPSPSTVAE
jgi:hypothetical protein